MAVIPTVAQMVKAEEYLAYDAPRAMYWAYWNAPGIWKTDPRYSFDMYQGNTFGDIRVIFQTDYDQLLIGSLPSIEKAQNWRLDPSTSLIADLRSDPVIAPLIEGANPMVKFVELLKKDIFSGKALVRDGLWWGMQGIIKNL